MKKRLRSIMLVLLTAMILSITVYAEGAKFTVPEAGIAITIPDYYDVHITRDTPATDSAFQKVGITYSKAKQMMQEGEIYLDCLNSTTKEELIVDTTPTDAADMSASSDEELMNTVKSTNLAEQFKKMGSELEKYEITSFEDAKYLKMYIKSIVPSSNAFAVVYYTVVDRKAIHITCYGYTQRVSAQCEKLLEQAVASIEYQVKPVKANANAGSNVSSANAGNDQSMHDDFSVVKVSLITLLLMLLPIVIFRLFIYSHPLKRIFAVALTLLYGIAAFLIVFFFRAEGIYGWGVGVVATFCILYPWPKRKKTTIVSDQPSDFEVLSKMREEKRPIVHHICPYCGKDNDEENIFCQECGAAIKKEDSCDISKE